MIALFGIPTEPPLALVAGRLAEAGVPHLVWNQRRFGATELEFRLEDGRVSGRLRLEGLDYRLDEIRGAYIRLMDDQLLPELRGDPAGSPLRRRARAVHEALIRWTEIAPARVLNRHSAMGSNASKPYQAQLIAARGFDVPETLVTNDPDLVRDFRARLGRVVYKSISGVRSIVRTLEDDDVRRLDRIRWCPTQFQEYIAGTDIRVHTVGDEVFATAVRSGATDYRYAGRDGGDPAQLEPIDLPDDLAERCAALARGLGLGFAGIDLRQTPEGRVYCFEVNPSPAFSYYEHQTGQPISRAVARHLSSPG